MYCQFKNMKIIIYDIGFFFFVTQCISGSFINDFDLEIDYFQRKVFYRNGISFGVMNIQYYGLY